MYLFRIVSSIRQGTSQLTGRRACLYGADGTIELKKLEKYEELKKLKKYDKLEKLKKYKELKKPEKY